MRGVAFGVLAGVLAASAFIGPAPRAQPAHSDLSHAKDLYKSAEAAMTEARYADAIRDYGAAYEITKDPVLFYKIGSANERLGKCEVALIYYKRYLKEGRPSEQFERRTHERITACGGKVDAGPATPAGTGSGSAAAVDPGAGSGSGTGSATEPTPGLPAPATTPTDAPPPKLGRNRGPWLLVGGSIAFLTLGSVLAYSSDAAENDVDDLYVGLNGMPPVFDSRTQRRYEEAIDEGQRYQTLSLISFGLAGALAAGAAAWFVVDRRREPAMRVEPTMTRDSAGVRAIVRF